jgi:putative aldouronate transport system substrate-binding protein
MGIFMALSFEGGLSMKQFRKNKRLVYSSFVTALAMMAIITGCSNSEQTGKAGEAKSGEGQATEQAKRGNITSSIYDRGTVPPEEGTAENNRWTKWINENGPTTVKFMAVPRFESQPKFNVMFASGTAPDLIFEYDTNYRNQLYNQKQLRPVDDLVDKYSVHYKKLLVQYPQLKKLGMKSDGKMYEFGRINGLGTNHVLFIRNDWLKKLNLQVPKTTEELYTVAKAFATQDPDGNGKNDTFGIGLSFVSGMIIDRMFGNVTWLLENGKLVHDWERTQAAFDFRKKLYEEGIVDKDFLTDSKGEKSKQDWLNGKLGIYGANGGVNFSELTTYESLKKNNPNAEIIPIALPRSPFGQFSPVISNPVQMTTVVNAAAKDPEAVMKLIDFLASPKAAMAVKNGIEGVHYKMENGCPMIIDADKKRKEVGYANDLAMMASEDLSIFKKCNSIDMVQNPTQNQKDFYKLRTLAEEAYLNKERPMPDLTHGEHMPVLPADLQLASTNANKAILDIWQKSIISGASYNTEQAFKDAKAAWDKANGGQIDEWYAKWYDENKDKWFLTKDMYDFIPK